jgi:ASC-1-like (ASCH) protein
MDHVAIMKKSWGFLPKIVTGQKTIESRWYKSKHCPWDSIKSGEAVYFKDAGSPITVKCTVGRVLQFSDLTSVKVGEILRRYGREDGIDDQDVQNYFESFKDKKYCLLIFLGNPTKISPFQIDKKGFGARSAWISVEDIEAIRVK